MGKTVYVGHLIDEEKTVVCLYQFKVMSFTVYNAFATLKSLKELLLIDLMRTTSLIFLGDIVVIGRNFLNLKYIFSIRNTYLQLKAKTYLLFLETINFIGHIASIEGIDIDPDKMKVVQD